jgi:hypothetical protein
MLLILSSEHDQSTFDIVDWLLFYKAPYILINEAEVKINEIRIPENDIILEAKNNINNETFQFNVNDLTGFWYRRGRIRLCHLIEQSQNEIVLKLNKFIENELISLETYLYNHLEKLHGFGRFRDNFINKLLQLEEAHKSGFKIPNTHIVTKLSQLKKNTDHITKGITYNSIFYKTLSFGCGTVEIDIEQNRKTEQFFPSLFQEKIKKKYELRIFHLDGKNFYQKNNKNTSPAATDCRRFVCNVGLQL